MSDESSRLGEARATARALVAALEDDALPIAQVLMKARKLARLTRDSGAQRWLQLETSGYPERHERVGDLGGARKYAGRFNADGTMYTPSLPELEAYVESNRALLGSLQHSYADSPVVENHVAGAATQKVLQLVNARQVGIRNAYAASRRTFERYRGYVYDYAVDTLIALELGDTAESIFDQARAAVDAFVRDRVPKGAEQLLAANDRLREGTPEALSAALSACRRFMVSVADALFEPQSQRFRDLQGKERKVGPDEYKNRLLAFIQTAKLGETTADTLAAQLTHVADRLDALHRNSCKGVHSDVSLEEARLVFLETYLIVAEIIQIAPPVSTVDLVDAPSQTAAASDPSMHTEVTE